MPPVTARPPAWVRDAVWWHVYPLGFVDAHPPGPDGPPGPGDHRLLRLVDWLDHAVALGASGIALGPIFASRTHGYDTTDHFALDPRLGDDGDVDALFDAAHRRGLRVLLDGVFHHVGVDFPRHREAIAGGDASWFRRGRDGFAVFEGHADLIALDHRHPAVADHVVEVMRHWLDRGADGWRLDAAYAVPDRFWATVLPRVRETHPDAWFVGEVIHGDAPATVRASTCDALTQYELWKAVWSSLVDGNFHELDHALRRHTALLEVCRPMTFVGNHDVTRIAARLDDDRHLPHALVVLFTVGGVPSVYAGDEFGMRAVKEERVGGDDAVRPAFGAPPGPDGVPDGAPDGALDVLRTHRWLIGMRRRHRWLHDARTETLRCDNTRYVYRTAHGDDALVVALNLDDAPMTVAAHRCGARALEVLGGTGAPPQQVTGRVEVPGHGWVIAAPR